MTLQARKCSRAFKKRTRNALRKVDTIFQGVGEGCFAKSATKHNTAKSATKHNSSVSKFNIKMALMSMLLMLLLAVSSALSARIAGFCAFGGSQYINTRHTLEELANRGHEVHNSRVCKNLEFQLALLDKQLSNVVCLKLGLVDFFSLIPAEALHPATENENLLARRANLIVSHNRPDRTPE